jgi:hypothetical protein
LYDEPGRELVLRRTAHHHRLHDGQRKHDHLQLRLERHVRGHHGGDELLHGAERAVLMHGGLG